MALKDYYNIDDDSNFQVDKYKWLAQIFTAGSSYNVSSVKLGVGKSSPDPVGSIVVSIREVDGAGKPTGDDLCYVEINDFSSFDLNLDWIEFTFGSSASLTNGEKYAIIIKGEGYLTSGYVKWYYDSGNGYAGGHMIYSNTEGATWSTPGTNDAMFETHTSTSYVDLAGTGGGTGGGSGVLEIAYSYVDFAGTGGGSGDGSGALIVSGFPHDEKSLTHKRLIAIGNNQLWYEDI